MPEPQRTPEAIAAGVEVHEAATDRALALVHEQAAVEGIELGEAELLLVELGVAAGIVAAWREVEARGLLVPGVTAG